MLGFAVTRSERGMVPLCRPRHMGVHVVSHFCVTQRKWVANRRETALCRSTREWVEFPPPVQAERVVTSSRARLPP